jgi:hypothetical protein
MARALTLKERVELYGRQAAILERVANQYAEGSAERVAIRQAAIALWYALTEQKGDFLSFLQRWEKGELTLAEQAQLKSMGIDPDAVDS